MPWSDDLRGVHLAIARFPGRLMRVVAGPGTGKTFAIIRRVARLLEEGSPPERVLAVTFTRTAAADLVAKLATLQSPGADQVRASTLHSICFSILHRNEVFEITRRVPRPLLDHELAMVICDLEGQFGGKRATKKLIKAFASYWATLQHLDPGWPAVEEERQFDRSLRGWLTFHRAILIDELVPLCLDFVRNNPLSPLTPRFDHVVADEYQDLNRADQVLIDALASRSQTIAVAGDEDQSIYSFRYANPEGIVSYPAQHPGTHDEVLVECRRCPANVVRVATDFITHNQRSRPDTIQTSPANPAGTIYVVQHDTAHEEAATLAGYIDWYLHQHPEINPGEVLVLATRRRFGYAVRDALNAVSADRNRGWQSRSFFLEESLEKESAKAGFTLLTLLADSTDRPALRAWLGMGQADGRSRQYAKLRSHCEEQGMTPWEALEAMEAGRLRLPRCQPLLDRYRLVKGRLAELSELQGSGLVEALFPGNDEACADVRSLALDLADDDKSPADLLRELRDSITQPELPGETDPVVRVMSLHKSKGLTAKLVIIAGAVTGALPTLERDLTPTEQVRKLEEQRRLFYVAMTRTTDTLVISSAVQMSVADAMNMGITILSRRYGQAQVRATPFLAELGAGLPRTLTGREWRAQVGF